MNREKQANPGCTEGGHQVKTIVLVAVGSAVRLVLRQYPLLLLSLSEMTAHLEVRLDLGLAHAIPSAGTLLTAMLHEPLRVRKDLGQDAHLRRQEKAGQRTECKYERARQGLTNCRISSMGPRRVALEFWCSGF